MPQTLQTGQNLPWPGDAAYIVLSAAGPAPRVAVIAETSAGAQVVADTTSERLSVKLDAQPDGVERLIVVGVAESAATWREGATTLRCGPTSAAADYTIEYRLIHGETAALLAEFYKRNGAWKLRALGEGYADGLDGLERAHRVRLAARPAVSSAAETPLRPEPVTSTGAPSAAPIAEPRRRAPKADPALLVAATGWENARANVVDSAAKFGDVLEQAAAAFKATLPSADPDLRQLTTSWNLVRDAWYVRFKNEPLPATPSAEPATLASRSISVKEWHRKANELTRELIDSRKPLGSNARRIYKNGLSGKVRDLANSMGTVRLLCRAQAWSVMSEKGPRAAEAVLRAGIAAIRKPPDPPAPIGPYGGGNPSAEQLPVQGIGPMRIQLGWAVPSEGRIISTKPGDSSSTSLKVDVPELRLPAIYDLDVSGGFVTSNTDLVERAVVQLMAAVPSGQLQLRIVDPLKLGESANFIYGLGDAAEKIIGQKVKTTDRELADLLVETEEHITFVTQKYLQGSFESLTEYNLASGDVAEPYRVLVFFNYPHGFWRDQRYDSDQLSRLQKIVTAGRRCGVFVFAATSNDPDVSQPYGPAISQLPWVGYKNLDPEAMNVRYGLPEPVAKRMFRIGDDVALTWRFEPVPPLPIGVRDTLIAHVERGLRTAADVRVEPRRVAELAATALARDIARGTRRPELLADPDDPSTWWASTTLEHASAFVGRQGASGVAQVRLDSQISSGVLIGGRPGAGKSVFIHAFLMSLAQRYGPRELELYLVDFKEGVEFKQYATYRLPHARVVAIESEREFGVSVLESIVEEISRRGQLFRDVGGGEETNFGQYRTRTGRDLPRIVLVIDEFQVMLDKDDKVGSRAAELLEKVIRTGRAFGVHCVLASQTIAGIPALGRHLPNLIPIRVVLQTSDADSRLLLSDDNADAKLLSRPGEGILNTKGGIRDANDRFQATFWDAAERSWALERLAERGRAEGFTRRPVIFEGQRGAQLADYEDAILASTSTELSLPIGAPMSLGEIVRMKLRREPGANCLLIQEGSDLVALSIAMLARGGIDTRVCDFGAGDDAAQALLSAAMRDVAPLRRREAVGALRDLAKTIRQRHEAGDYSAPTIAVVLNALHRAREFEPADEWQEDSDAAVLKYVLREGPEVGVHVIAWVEKPASVQRRLSTETLREFSMRVLGPCSRDDSQLLVDSDAASTLKSGQAIVDDHSSGRQDRVRVFQVEDPRAITEILVGGRR